MLLTSRGGNNRTRTYRQIVKYFQESNMLGDLELHEPRRGRYADPCEIFFKTTFSFILSFQALRDEFSIQFRKLQAFLTNCHTRIAQLRQETLQKQVNLLNSRVRFLKENRYHHIAKDWLKFHMKPALIFNYLNSQTKSLKAYLEWNTGAPYVTQGCQDVVRQHLLENLPRPVVMKSLHNYGF